MFVGIMQMFVFSCSFMSDFDIMLARRKAMNSKRRRHRDGGTFINDADDVVSAMITKMNEAAEVGISTAAPWVSYSTHLERPVEPCLGQTSTLGHTSE